MVAWIFVIEDGDNPKCSSGRLWEQVNEGDPVFDLVVGVFDRIGGVFGRVGGMLEWVGKFSQSNMTLAFRLRRL